MEQVVIKARLNGPYKITGPVTITDADGSEYDLSETGEAVASMRRVEHETVLRRHP
jgi:hypothetical protein